ncbi:hypothetical protein JCM5350_006405 [Sporobolomyces pararoseus]
MTKSNKKNPPSKQNQGPIPNRNRPLQNFNQSRTQSPFATTSESTEAEDEEPLDSTGEKNGEDFSTESKEEKQEMNSEEKEDEETLKEQEELLNEKNYRLARLEWKMSKLKKEISELETTIEESRE